MVHYFLDIQYILDFCLTHSICLFICLHQVSFVCIRGEKLDFILDEGMFVNKVNLHTVCPRSFDPFYILCYYTQWIKSSWIYSMSNQLFIEFHATE